VRDGHDEGRSSSCVHRPEHGVGGPQRLWLFGKTDVEPFEQAPDLVAEVTDDDGDRRQLGLLQLPEQRGDHRLAVDRQERLRPAFGERTQAPPLAGGDYDRFHLRGTETHGAEEKGPRKPRPSPAAITTASTYEEPKPSERRDRSPRNLGHAPRCRRRTRRTLRTRLRARG